MEFMSIFHSAKLLFSQFEVVILYGKKTIFLKKFFLYQKPIFV